MTDEIGFVEGAIRAASPRRSCSVADITAGSAAGYSMLRSSNSGRTR